MNGNTRKVARTGSIMVRINNKFYEVPDNVLLFKSHDGKDIYLSGVKNDSKNDFRKDWVGIVKFIEDDKFENVPLALLEKFMDEPYKKFVIDDEEYDIPLHLSDDCRQKISKISKYVPRILRELKESYKDFLFKSN
jgi:hypothetical protein